MKSNILNTYRYYTAVIAGVLLGLVIGVGTQLVSAAWFAPTAAPPGNNVAAPINISSTYQYKNGRLGAVRMDAHIFHDYLDTSWYLQPRATSRINNLWIGGDTRAPYPNDDDDIATKKYVDDQAISVVTAVGPTRSCDSRPGQPCQGPSVATCPAGYSVTGGGNQWMGDYGCGSTYRFVMLSAPSGTTGWQAQMACSNYRAYAVCAK